MTLTIARSAYLVVTLALACASAVGQTTAPSTAQKTENAGEKV